MSVTPKPQGDTPHELTPAHSSLLDEYWENYPSIDTPIVEDELNRIEQTLDELDARVLNMDIWKAEQADLQQTPKSITYEKTTGVFTITFWNGAVVPIDTDIEKIAINFDYDDDPTSLHYQQLIITLDDGDPTAVPPIPATVKYVDLSALITQYEFNNSNTIGFTVGANDGSVSAEVLDGSITGAKLQPNYLADCLAAKGGAENAEADAIAKALVAEGYANGKQNGVPVTSGSPYYENNAEYFKDQAQSIVGSKVDSFNGRTGVVTSQSGDYAIEDITPTNATDGQIAVARSDGQGGIAFSMENIPSSGHTIVNPSGTDMAQEDKLQFTGNVSVTDDSQNGKTVIDIPNMTLVDRTFNVVVADWITNPDSTTSSDYPYIYQISTAYYTASSKPIWQMNGAGTIPTSAEREDIDLIMEAIFDTTGITLYATDMPTNAMVLEVKG